MLQLDKFVPAVSEKDGKLKQGSIKTKLANSIFKSPEIIEYFKNRKPWQRVSSTQIRNT